MPQLVKGGKHVFGWTRVGKAGRIAVPPEALEEYSLHEADRLILVPGSQTSGGFGLGSPQVLIQTPLWTAIETRPELEAFECERGSLIECDGKLMGWVELQHGEVTVPLESLKHFGINAGDSLLVVRGSGRALGFIVKGPITAEARKHPDLPVFFPSSARKIQHDRIVPMTTGQDHYRRFVAQYWDLLRGDTSQWPSRPYFLKLIQENGQPALDVACGTGRLLFDYLQAGIDIDGVDISPDMIAAAEKNARESGFSPCLYIQPMQELNLPRRYRTIIVPSSSFLHLVEKEDVEHALNRLYDHLEPGGLLAMSMRIMDASKPEIDWEIDAEAIRLSDGATIRKWFRCWYDAEKRFQHTEDRYEVILNGDIIQSESYLSSPFLTWYSLEQALDLLQSAGFAHVRAHSDFTFNPATAEDTSYIVLGNRPA